MTEVARNIFVLSFSSPELARSVLPGQFVNIKVAAGYSPLLRRPFSVYRTKGESVEVIFNAIGRGTTILSRKKGGDEIDVLGPLGVPYRVDDGFSTGLLVAGGLGVAPLPIMTTALQQTRKQIFTFLGARTVDQVVPDYLENVFVATGDGSKGFQGTVVELLEKWLRNNTVIRPKIFACGPNAMLKRLAELAVSRNVACEASLECTMACGFGICQGCPVERAGHDAVRPKYHLVCKDGPVFNINDVIIE